MSTNALKLWLFVIIYCYFLGTDTWNALNSHFKFTDKFIVW